MKIKDLQDQGLILFEALRGSQAYGTNTPESDEDKVYVFMSPLDDRLGLTYREQLTEDNNDTVAYELGRFLQLLQTANPTVVETLFTPEDCILYKHPIFDHLIAVRDMFITKKMKNSFGGYARQQIQKASGLQKMMNLEKDKVTRKTILDFVYTQYKQGSILFTKILKKKGLKQEYCGLVAIPHMRYTYAVYYDIIQHFQKEKTKYGSPKYYDVLLHMNQLEYFSSEEEYNSILKGKNLKYKGIVQDVDKSNDISLSSVPKGIDPIATIQVNLDGYQQHCKKYKEYQTWLKERNTSRYVDIENHGQQIDGKNMLHCVRLLRMSKEIASGEGVIMRRPDAQYLLDIRKGKYNLKEILAECEEVLKDNDKLFDESNLPKECDFDLINQLLINMRKQFYGIG